MRSGVGGRGGAATRRENGCKLNGLMIVHVLEYIPEYSVSLSVAWWREGWVK